MKARLILCTLCALIFSQIGLAGSTTVLLGERLCDKAHSLCVKTTINYDYSSGYLMLHGRVGQNRAKGHLYIAMRGQTNDQTIRSKLSVPIDGESFQLVSSKSRTAVKNRHIRWYVDGVSFKPSRP